MENFYKNSYKMLAVILLLVLLFLFRFESPIIETLANFGSLVILILGIFLIVGAIRLGIVNNLGSDLQTLLIFWSIAAGWMLIVPYLFFNYSFNAELFYQGMFHDYRYIIFSFLPFFFVTNEFKTYYDKILKYSSWVALCLGIAAIILSDKSISSVAQRDFSRNLPYFYWWIVMFTYPYWFLKFYSDGKNKIGLALLLINVIMSIFLLKRSGFTNSLMIILLSFITSKFSFKSFLFLLVSGFGLIAIFFFYSELFDLLIFRFFGEVDDLEEWDRNLEIKEFFDNVTDFQLFTGFGVNNYLNMLYVGQTEEGVNSLHIGIYNILYKGGWMYASFMIFLSFKILTLYKFISKDPEIKMAFVLGVYSMIGLLYEGGWSYMPTIFYSMYPVYRGFYLKGKLLKNN
jgi:hypothetical protein